MAAVTISLTNLKSEVKKHLSVIGKRTYSKDGKNMFSNITVSTAEDQIIDQYLVNASQALNAALHQFVTTWSVSGSNLSVELVNARNDANFQAKTKEYIETYMTLFATGDYLAMTHPELAQKYKEDVASALQSLMMYVYYKIPITPTANPLSPTVVVT